MGATALRTRTVPLDHSARVAAFCGHPDSGSDLAALDRIGTVISFRRDPARCAGDAELPAACRWKGQVSEFALPGEFIALELADAYRSTAEAAVPAVREITAALAPQAEHVREGMCRSVSTCTNSRSGHRRRGSAAQRMVENRSY
jgi:hypothetical protein